METFLSTINNSQLLFWEYLGLPAIVLMGLYLTYISRGMQFKVLWNFKRHIAELRSVGYKKADGVHPFKLFFASVGGMVGIGNIVSVGAAISIGGPGSIFWMWIASLSGMLIKYSEIYLGIKYRVSDGKGSYNGGPMYYLQVAFKNKFFAYASAVLLCIYGIEIYQFTVIVDRIEHTFHIERNLVTLTILVLCLYTVIGGVRRMANICSVMMPLFMFCYILVCAYIIFMNYQALPEVFYSIFHGAFNGHAPIGGFIGSTMTLVASTGVARGVYASDIGVGYDSVVQSETMAEHPKQQARVSIYALFTDTFICMMTTLVFAVTGGWHKMSDAQSDVAVSQILGMYLPYSEVFMTCLLFLAGFTTVVAYFSAGMKNAHFIHHKYGTYGYLLYAIFAFVFFTNYPADAIMSIMLLIAPLLLLLNIAAIIKLIKVIEF
jgi:AGCS family alanine or glycine:cation symporter